MIFGPGSPHRWGNRKLSSQGGLIGPPRDDSFFIYLA